MKYAIQGSYHMWDKETETEYDEWMYVGVEGKLRLFVFDEDVTKNTKLFKTAREAGAYMDNYFGPDEVRCSFSSVRIVEVEDGDTK